MLKDGRTLDLKMPYREVCRHELEMALQYGEEEAPIELTPLKISILISIAEQRIGTAFV
jgi:hypothetical protein